MVPQVVSNVEPSEEGLGDVEARQKRQDPRGELDTGLPWLQAFLPAMKIWLQDGLQTPAVIGSAFCKLCMYLDSDVLTTSGYCTLGYYPLFL